MWSDVVLAAAFVLIFKLVVMKITRERDEKLKSNFAY